MQPDVSSMIPEDLRATQFALDLLNDLAKSNARSSVWDAQVELLTDIVKSSGRNQARAPGDTGGSVKDARTRVQVQRAAQRTPFVPMS